MKHFNLFTSAAILLAFSVSATPALAQRHSPRDRGVQSNSGSGARTESRSRESGGQRQDNTGAVRRAPQPSAASVAPRAETPRSAAAPRVEQRVQPRSEAIPRAVPRAVYPRYDSRVVTGRPYYDYSRPYYARPYYAFRPRLSLGFGLWLGYPVTYPYAVYGYPYPSTYPYPYPGGTVSVAPGTNVTSGGLSFEISPATATVYVDGDYVGVVSDFTPNMPPLGLTPGRHQIEVREPGFETMTFDADIVAGQVLPFQGTMQRF